jgi:hypothetical protein
MARRAGEIFGLARSEADYAPRLTEGDCYLLL